MEAFINSLACISPHNTTAGDFFFEDTSVIPESPFLSVVPPAYKDYIPANTIRRTSHILKMGISAGLMCLRNGGLEKTDAIIVGTAMGCYEDTDKFLRAISDNNERLLAPTSFIQSTHNTVAGQIALLVKSHGYNFTYVHQNLSFEFALSDALLLLEENEAEHVLVGGVDELNPPLCELFERAGHIKAAEHISTPIWQSNTRGYVAGEGAAFFNLSKLRAHNSVAKLTGIQTLQNVEDAASLGVQCDTFLNNLGLKKENISLLFAGINGDAEMDKMLNTFVSASGIMPAYFKHLCGEYFTAGAFALWLAATCLQKQKVPACVLADSESPESLEHILIVTGHQHSQYGFICLSRC